MTFGNGNRMCKTKLKSLEQEYIKETQIKSLRSPKSKTIQLYIIVIKELEGTVDHNIN